MNIILILGDDKMTEQRFQIKDSNSHYVGYDIIDTKLQKRYYGGRLVQCEELCDLLNMFYEEYIALHKYALKVEEKYEMLQNENHELQRQCYLIHMASMFSTVKSFKGDVSERYIYNKDTDNIYDTANNYGQYHKILEKNEVAMLLNEYETLLKELE